MAYRINGEMKDGRLVLGTPTLLSPFERVSSLGLEASETELIPLSTLFWEMKFPKGVYGREHEEAHFLNRILVSLHVSFLMKCNPIDPRITSIAAELSRPGYLIDQMNLPNWVAGENSLTKEHLDSIEAARKAAGGVGDLSSIAETARIVGDLNSITKTAQMLGNLDSITKAADLAGRFDSISQSANIPNNASYVQGDFHNPYVHLLQQVPKIPKLEHREVSGHIRMDGHFDHVREENERQAEQQRARDKLQSEQVELTAQHLKLNAEQFEEKKRVQAQQNQTEKKTLWLTLFVAVITTFGLFFDSQEVRSLFSSAGDQISDLVASAVTFFDAFISSLFANDADD